MLSYLTISIVIPVFNEERYLRDCLDSLTKLDYPADKLEIIIVDNGSTDNSLNIANSYGFSVLIKEDVKVGAVRNYGASQANGEVLVFLDSDCVVETDWLKKGAQQIFEKYDAIGGLYLLRDNPSWLERNWILKSSKNSIYQKTLVGGCIFIKKSVFIALSGFDEQLSAAEDTDLTNRLISQGYEVTIDPKLSVVHLGFPSEVIPFIKRQMWHSEDCFLNFYNSLKDKTFILTNIYFLGFFLISFSLLSSNYIQLFTLYIGIFLVIFCPLILSIKRIKRYKLQYTQLIRQPSIIIVDTIYLVGRLLGAFRSLKMLIFKASRKKYNRR